MWSLRLAIADGLIVLALSTSHLREGVPVTLAQCARSDEVVVNATLRELPLSVSTAADQSQPRAGVIASTGVWTIAMAGSDPHPSVRVWRGALRSSLRLTAASVPAGRRMMATWLSSDIACIQAPLSLAATATWLVDVTQGRVVAAGSLQPRRASRQPSPEEALTGTWDARFDLELGDRLARPATAKHIEGEIGFNTAAATLRSMPDAAVYAGAFRIPFRKFGFAPDRSDAIGWHTDGASVRIILNSAVDHGHIELVGERQGPTIEGNWALIADPATASGRFTLRLRRAR